MPDLVIRNSKSCYDLENGNSLCNVVIEDKSKESLMGRHIPISLLAQGKIKSINDIKGCWKDKDGNTYCMVHAKGKNGSKEKIVKANVGKRIDPNIGTDNIYRKFTQNIRNNRSPQRRKCDPEKDENCKPYYY
jgi:hypothetical protein